MPDASRNRLLSIILLSFQSETRLAGASQKIRAVMEAEVIPYELIIMDDGSTDNSYQVAKGLAKGDDRIRAYRLSRNFTSPYAQFAGMSVAKGACAVSVPDDFQRPLELVVAMYRKWEEGHKLIIPYRKSRSDGFFNDFFSRLYYRLMTAMSEVRFPPGGTDGFLADREIIDLLNARIHPVNTTAVMEVLRLGFDPYFLGFDRPPSSTKHKSRWTFKKKFKLARDTFFGSSSYPLRVITLVGFAIFVICFLIVLLIVWAKIFTDNSLFGFPIQGWATLVVFVTMFNGLILLCLGIVSEYIWRIYEEVKGRPGYIIRKEDDQSIED